MPNVLRSKKISFGGFVLFYLTIGIIFPAFKAYTRIPAFYPALLLFVLHTIRNYPQIYFKRSLIWIYFLFLLNITYYYSGFYEFRFDVGKELFTRVFPYFIAAILVEYLLLVGNRRLFKKLGKFVFILVIIEAVLTIMAEHFYPGSTRGMKGETSYPWWVRPYSFGMAYGMPFVVGVFAEKYNGKKWIYILVLLFLLYSILVTGFFIAMLFTFAMLASGIFIKLGFRRIYYLTAIFILIALIYTYRFEVLDLIADFPHPLFAKKAQELKILLQSGVSTNEATGEIRSGVYDISLRGFMKSIFFGSGKLIYAGGHSFWLDKLAIFGILGTLPYLIVIVNIYQRAKLLLPDDEKGESIYQNGLILTLLLMFLNPYGFLDSWAIVFVYVPMIINYFDDKDKFYFYRALK